VKEELGGEVVHNGNRIAIIEYEEVMVNSQVLNTNESIDLEVVDDDCEEEKRSG